jgi:hypothetical protein
LGESLSKFGQPLFKPKSHMLPIINEENNSSANEKHSQIEMDDLEK